VSRVLCVGLAAGSIAGLTPFLWPDWEQGFYLVTTILVGSAAIELARIVVERMGADLGGRPALQGRWLPLGSSSLETPPMHPEQEGGNERERGDDTGREGALRLKLARVDLREAVLPDLDLERAELTGSLLEGADLGGAMLRRASLVEADLRGADLRRADLRGADLRGAKIEGTLMAGALYDRATLWPFEGDPPEGLGLVCTEEGSR
jgi:Pentapeptide repeats (8 copies)